MSNAELSNEVLVNLIKEGWDPDGKYMLQLWDQNQGLIRKIINHYQKYDSMDDLMQEAFIGLQKAVEQYEPMKEIPFFNHAAIWINNTLALYARGNGKYIRLPYTVYASLRKKKQFIQQYKNEHTEEPSDELIAKALEISLTRLREINNYESIFNYTPSLDEVTNEEDDLTLADRIPAKWNQFDDIEEQIFKKQVSETVWKEVDQLPDKLSRVVKLRYKGGYSITECAQITGKSPGCVNYRQKKAEALLGEGEHRERLLPCVDIYRSALSGSLSDYNRTQTSTTERIAIRNIERERRRYDRMIASFLQQFPDEEKSIRDFVSTIDIDTDVINNTVNDVYSKYLAFCQGAYVPAVSKIGFGKRICNMLDIESTIRKIHGETERVYVSKKRK